MGVSSFAQRADHIKFSKIYFGFQIFYRRFTLSLSRPKSMSLFTKKYKKGGKFMARINFKHAFVIPGLLCGQQANVSLATIDETSTFVDQREKKN